MVIISIVIIAKGTFEQRSDNSNFYLNISAKSSQEITGESLVNKIKPHSSRLVLRRFDQSDSKINLTFAAEFSDINQLQNAIEELKGISQELEVSYVENTGIM